MHKNFIEKKKTELEHNHLKLSPVFLAPLLGECILNDMSSINRMWKKGETQPQEHQRKQHQTKKLKP